MDKHDRMQSEKNPFWQNEYDYGYDGEWGGWDPLFTVVGVIAAGFCVVALIVGTWNNPGPYAGRCGSGSCSIKQPREATSPQYDLNKVVIVGNHSYLPIEPEYADHMQIILGVLRVFEKAHPELKVTGWRIERKQQSFGATYYDYGLWVDHEKR